MNEMLYPFYPASLKNRADKISDAELLISAMKKAKMSPKELATKTYISQHTIYAYRSGKRKITKESKTNMAKALGIDQIYLNDVKKLNIARAQLAQEELGDDYIKGDGELIDLSDANDELTAIEAEEMKQAISEYIKQIDYVSLFKLNTYFNLYFEMPEHAWWFLCDFSNMDLPRQKRCKEILLSGNISISDAIKQVDFEKIAEYKKLENKSENDYIDGADSVEATGYDCQDTKRKSIGEKLVSEILRKINKLDCFTDFYILENFHDRMEGMLKIDSEGWGVLAAYSLYGTESYESSMQEFFLYACNGLLAEMDGEGSQSKNATLG